MPRQPLPLGTWGEIRTHAASWDENGKPVRYRAIANYRDFDGRTKPVERWGTTATVAKNRLRTALKERSALSRQGEFAGVDSV